MIQQAHIFYSGMVQGVGFRYTVHRMVSQTDLTGWVRNLPDGRVEVLVEGDSREIDALIKAVDEHFDGYIKDKDISKSEANKGFTDFQITH